jgi:integrase
MATKNERGKIFRKLTDSDVSGMADFSPPGHLVWDSEARGLRIRIGRNRATWSFFAQHRRRGKRSTTYRKLGYFPTIGVKEARRLAQVVGGRVSGGQIETSKKDALIFEKAFADYCTHLLEKVQAANRAARQNDPTAPQKEPTWHRVVANLGKLYLLPQWGTWTLAEMSADPTAVRDWFRDLTKRTDAPVTANKCAKLVRAVYHHAKRLRRDLPPDLPTSAVKLNPEEPREAGMTDAEHLKWADALRKIKNPTRKAYHLLGLLTGQRPGELARLKLTDVLPEERCLVIRKAKADNNIRVPLSRPIEQALKRARDAHDGESEWLFPARAGGFIKRFDSDGLPCWGNGLRHNFKNIAVTMKPPVEEILTDFLLGHAPKGVSRKYVSAMIVAQSDALHDAQARISERLVALLGIRL